MLQPIYTECVYSAYTHHTEVFESTVTMLNGYYTTIQPHTKLQKNSFFFFK